MRARRGAGAELRSRKWRQSHLLLRRTFGGETAYGVALVAADSTQFAEAAANMLTNPQLDPYGKIPEFKFCAAKVELAKAAAEAAE